jgi:predicted ester cyclase
MNKIEIVKAFYSFDNFEKSAQYLSDDFQGTDSVGGPPFDKAGWIGMGQMFKGSLPDINVLIDDIHEDGDSVMVTSHFTGTFTNDFDLSAMGMGIIPASGDFVEFPTSKAKISFIGDKVSKFHDMDTGPDAGMPGLMKALGVTVNQ